LKARNYQQLAFTILELLITLTIVSLFSVLLLSGFGFSSWFREERAVRQFIQRVNLAKRLSQIERTPYILEINLSGQDLARPSYRIAATQLLADDIQRRNSLTLTAQTTGGSLNREFLDFISSVYISGYNLRPPPSVPSLFELEEFPSGMRIISVNTPRLRSSRSTNNYHVQFTPDGFSELTYIHLTYSSGEEFTLLLDPFSGSVEQIPGLKDFEWSLGSQ
jgi:type II secretory pathway pseudopilin PulG